MAKKDFEIFGKHILLERIAMGGMAEIFLAKSSGAGGISKFSAIKRILPQYSGNTDFISMFKDEAKINVNLSHSNIVPIYEFGVEAGQFYILMEYVNGKNLRQILNRMQKESDTYFSIDQIVNIIKDVAAGLDHAHRCLDGTTGKPLNIIHRDMSPQNIMISFEGEIKVVDFGIAKAESQQEATKAGTLKGKFAYMSPEQATGESIDLRTDIFSLGIVLWELLAKERLFVAESEIGTLKKIREGKIPSIRKLNPNVPEELEKIVNKSLTKSTTDRYQTCADFQKDLNKFLNVQYPEFSSQDFSIFIKSLYADEILQNRKKLIEYSGIKFDPNTTSTLNEDDPTLVGITRTDLEIDDISGFEKSNSILFDDLESSQKSQFDIKSINISKDRPKPKKNTNFEAKPVRPTTQSNYNYNYNHHHQTHSNQPQKFNVQDYSKYIIMFLVAAGLALIASQLFPNRASEKEQASMNERLPENLYDRINEKYITVNSSPQGAEVVINGVGTGQLTPARVKIPSDKEFIIGLKKQDYIDYQQRIQANYPNTEFRGSLTKVRVGYLDIDVKPRESIVYINGTQLIDRLPIIGYKFPADRKITIKAVNKVSRKYDEVEVILKSDETQKIELRPTKTQ